MDSHCPEIPWAIEHQEATISDEHAAHLYDAVNHWGADDAFFLNIATSGGSVRVLNLGCGTGRITVAIAQAGVAVTGIDPHQPSVAAAQKKPHADRMEWIIGDSHTLPASREFGVAIMSSNVAQAILDDEDPSRTFRDIAARMPSGGQLAFDSRDPRRREQRTDRLLRSRGECRRSGDEDVRSHPISAARTICAHCSLTRGSSSTLFSVGSKGNRSDKASGHSSSPLTARRFDGQRDVVLNGGRSHRSQTLKRNSTTSPSFMT